MKRPFPQVFAVIVSVKNEVSHRCHRKYYLKQQCDVESIPHHQQTFRLMRLCKWISRGGCPSTLKNWLTEKADRCPGLTIYSTHRDRALTDMIMLASCITSVAVPSPIMVSLSSCEFHEETNKRKNLPAVKTLAVTVAVNIPMTLAQVVGGSRCQFFCLPETKDFVLQKNDSIQSRSGRNQFWS